MSARRQTLLSYLDDHLQRGDEIVFAHRRGARTIRWSYKDLFLTAHRVAHELTARNITNGDRVILCGENSPEWVAAFWGCLLQGVVVVPLDKESTRDFVQSVQQQTDAKLIFATSTVANIDLLPVPRIQLDDLRESLAHQSTQPHSIDDLNENTLAEIIFTSGTTSTPKGVLLTHGNLLANLQPLEHEIAKYIKWEWLVHPLRFLNLVPLSHVFGQVMGVFVPQLLGGEVHFHDTLNPAEIVRRIREERISVLVLVPRMLDSLRDWLERNQSDRDHFNQQLREAEHANAAKRWWIFRRIHNEFGWKFWAVLSGGATLNEQTETFWRRLGFAVLQGYGMTETASLVTVTHPFKTVRGSIGQLMPGYEVRLDETGEIMVRGASVSPGYWTSNGQTDRSDEWLHTGDVGEMDAAGNLYFKGRKRDVIVTAAGLNVYPEDLEEALNRQPGVRASCVIKWSGAKGVEPLAVIILRDSNVSAEAAVAAANQSLADFQRIRRWHVWAEPDFPRTATQKVLKREVAARIELKGEARAGGRNETDSASSVVLSEAARITGQEVSSARNAPVELNDLKLDSLGRIELLSALEQRYQIEIDEERFTAATTVDDVEKIIRGEMEENVAPYPYPNWSQRFPLTWLRWVLFYLIIFPITMVMSRMRVFGRNKVEHLNGPVLFVANHVTLADHALVLMALPAGLRHRLAIAMEGERLRDWLHPGPGASLLQRVKLKVQYFLVTTFFNVFPLPKRSGFRRSFEYAGKCVDQGRSVLVFPEGERAPRGQLHMSAFKSGIGLLAKELDVPVVPVKLNGLYDLKQRQKYFAEPGVVSVLFGEPIKFDANMNPGAIAEELQRRVWSMS